MKESVLDILIELFENDLDAGSMNGGEPDRDTLEQELAQAGCSPYEVGRALTWLGELCTGRQRVDAIPPSRAVRVFHSSEQLRLDLECRGYILHLENSGILSPAQRELVIDRLLALDARRLTIEQIKWVTLMVLFSQPGQENALLRMEDLVFDNRLAAVH